MGGARSKDRCKSFVRSDAQLGPTFRSGFATSGIMAINGLSTSKILTATTNNALHEEAQKICSNTYSPWLAEQKCKSKKTDPTTNWFDSTGVIQI